MTTSHKARQILHTAMRATNVKQIRMLRGQFTKAINNAKLSDALAESAKREFERIVGTIKPRNNYRVAVHMIDGGE